MSLIGNNCVPYFGAQKLQHIKVDLKHTNSKGQPVKGSLLFSPV